MLQGIVKTSNVRAYCAAKVMLRESKHASNLQKAQIEPQGQQLILEPAGVQAGYVVA